MPEFGSFTGAEALADGDIKLTNSVLTFARHLAVGRIAPTRVSAEVDYGNHTPEPADILKKVADARDANAALDSFNPPHDGFRALKAKLAELRRSSGAARQSHSRRRRRSSPATRTRACRALRARLGVAGKPDDLIYDKALFNAVRNVQHRADIKPTGVIDAKTLAAINGPKPGQQVERVLANMERWRWLPRDLGRTYVMVNIPDFTLKVVRDNSLVWRTKIVAGKPQTPTPLVTRADGPQSSSIRPGTCRSRSSRTSCCRNMQATRNIFDRMGLEVKRGPDGNINVVQPPGAANALGRIKFAFPNKFQVYLHDTPEKRLFATRSARSATAACGWRIRPSSARSCCV